MYRSTVPDYGDEVIESTLSACLLSSCKMVAPFHRFLQDSKAIQRIVPIGTTVVFYSFPFFQPLPSLESLTSQGVAAAKRLPMWLTIRFPSNVAHHQLLLWQILGCMHKVEECETCRQVPRALPLFDIKVWIYRSMHQHYQFHFIKYRRGAVKDFLAPESVCQMLPRLAW